MLVLHSSLTNSSDGRRGFSFQLETGKDDVKIILSSGTLGF